MLRRLFYLSFILISFFTFNQTLYAQAAPAEQVKTQLKGTYLKAVILDSVTREPIEFATLSAKYIGEKDPKKYALTDAKGVAVLQGMGVGRATMKFEYMGYKPKTFTVDVKKGANDIGEILVQEDVNLLNAVVVTGESTPMVVKKDTVEYSASAFKVNETDALEELLKKIPGIEIDSEGKITANGKSINKIMIEGKTYFLDDPKIASKNLPAKIVNKVRVVERKSDQARFTGIDDGQEETVIDLGIKPGMMNGLFGNIGGGYGTDNRYQVNGFLGSFKEKGSIMIFAGANNTNNRGFSEMGGMGFRGGGRAFGSGAGITTSWNVGVGANKTVLDGKMKLQGNYMYMGSEKDVQEKKNKQTLLTDTTSLYNNESSDDFTRSQGHGIFGEMDYAISDKTSLLFRPRINLSNNSFNSENRFATLNNTDSTNRGVSRSFGDSDSQDINGELLFRQRLGKPGRTLSLSLNYSYSNSESVGYNQSETYYFADDSLAAIDQKYSQVNRTNGFGGRFSYTEPLGKNYFLEGAYRYNYKKTNSDKDTWNKDAEGNYNILDKDYTSHYENIFITQQAELNFMKQESKYNFTLGVSMQPSTTKSFGRGVRDTTYSVLNFAPSARLDYRFSDEKFLRLRYRGRTNQPSISQLLPVPDNSNPLQIIEGNDGLQPEFTHSLGTEYNVSKRAKSSYLSVSLDASYTSDKIVTKKEYTPDGIQLTTYENTSQPIYSTSARLFYNTKIGKSNFSFNTYTSLNFGNGVSYVQEKGTKGYVENVTKNLSASENLRFTYRNNFAEIIAGGRVSYRDAWYTVNSMDKVATWSNAVTASVNINIPGGFNVTSDIEHTFYYGYDSYYGKSSTMWNAELSKKLFKDAAVLKVKIYDILKDARSVNRTTSENYIQDVETNILKQYVMFSLVYQFGKFGGGSGMRMGPRGMRGGGMYRR